MPSPYRLRDATQDDVPRLVELLLRMDAHVAGVPRARLQPTAAGWQDLASRFEHLIADPGACVLVIACRNRIVAMGQVRVWQEPHFWDNPERRPRGRAMIDDVWVEPRHRRRGLAGDLVAGLVGFALRHGVPSIMLEYSASNPEAEQTWTALGFRPTGIRAEASASEILERLDRPWQREEEP